jgi:hypothetical protein
MTALWEPAQFGCIERDSFQLHRSTRIAVTVGDVPPIVSRHADLGAPVQASWTTNPSDAQYRTFSQWVENDLARGALAFLIDLWLWDRVQRVRARLQGPYDAQRMAFDSWQLRGTFEIEGEEIDDGPPK